MRELLVPPTATRLFLGFFDSYSWDNAGFLQVQFQFQFIGAKAVISLALDGNGNLVADASGSHTAEGSIAGYSWLLTPQAPGGQPVTRDGPVCLLSGLPPGAYDVTLTVQDSAGHSDSTTSPGVLVPSGSDPVTAAKLEKALADLGECTGDLGVCKPQLATSTADLGQAAAGLAEIARLQALPWGLRASNAGFTGSLGPALGALLQALLAPEDREVCLAECEALHPEEVEARCRRACGPGDRACRVRCEAAEEAAEALQKQCRRACREAAHR